ncbi:hypothetical protein NC652_040878 [Populus alba x Populus x berolinensis]|nr:hypothetical protein NC652_040878 [Populus alba x Populus x berolinensis]
MHFNIRMTADILPYSFPLLLLHIKLFIDLFVRLHEFNQKYRVQCFLFEKNTCSSNTSRLFLLPSYFPSNTEKYSPLTNIKDSQTNNTIQDMYE